MLHAVLVASFPCPEVFNKDDSARVIAHNLSREAAQAMEQSLHFPHQTAIGEDFKMLVFIAEYETPHAASETNECEDCLEVLLAYHRQMLARYEKEAARRGGRILEDNLDNP
jgi:hypothetical protein